MSSVFKLVSRLPALTALALMLARSVGVQTQAKPVETAIFGGTSNTKTIITDAAHYATISAADVVAS